jgi:hypothetical protein
MKAIRMVGEEVMLMSSDCSTVSKTEVVAS